MNTDANAIAEALVPPSGHTVQHLTANGGSHSAVNWTRAVMQARYGSSNSVDVGDKLSERFQFDTRGMDALDLWVAQSLGCRLDGGMCIWSGAPEYVAWCDRA